MNVKEVYEDYLEKLAIRESLKKPKPIVLSKDKMSEKEKCKYLGIPCEYGICSECE